MRLLANILALVFDGRFLSYIEREKEQERKNERTYLANRTEHQRVYPFGHSGYGGSNNNSCNHGVGDYPGCPDDF